MPIKVLIASPLRSYTGADEVEARGSDLAALLADLDARYPGIRFRMVDEQGALRRHMNVFVDGERVRDLSVSLEGVDEVVVMQALSGGA